MPDILAKECLQCPTGSYCVGEHLNPEPCPPGFYCPAGTGFNWQPCPPGTFNSQLGLHNVSCKNNLFLNETFKNRITKFCADGLRKPL